MEGKENRSEARKKALKELLEGLGMTVLGVVMWMLGGDFTFVEGEIGRASCRERV